MHSLNDSIIKIYKCEKFPQEIYPDDLPEESEHEVRFALGQVVGVDVDDVAADGLRRRQRQGEVLMLCVQG